MENHELETAIRIAGALLLVMCLIVLGWVIFLRATAEDKAEAQESPAPTVEAERIVLPSSAKRFALSPLYIIAATPEAEAWKPAPARDIAEPTVNGRYNAVEMTDAERDELAAIIWLEARGESAEGQQAVAEVVLNRVISADFPDTVTDVLHDGEHSGVKQFSSIGALPSAAPETAQYAAIDAALYGENILPADVVYFSRGAENGNIWGSIGGHVFCYGYDW
ncbi:MAG: cell wall hydrolase [Oscillospiraceae bacterium]|nr:cell wall hydrolase [Oscillospiraceae bacterium]